MTRCDPVEMNKNLKVVDQYRRAGIDFVAVPVKNEDHKNEMIQYGNEVLEEVINESES